MSDNLPIIITTPGFALTAAEQMSTALWRNTIDNRFTQPQFLALCGLFHKPGSGHYSLADMLGIDRATIGPILKKLIDQKLVERRKDPQDSRRSVLTLQPLGETALAEMAVQVKRVDSQLMAPLSLAEQAALVQSWAILAENVMQKEPERPLDEDGGGIPTLEHYPWFFLRQACRFYRRLWRELVDDNISSSLFALLDVVAASPNIDIRGAALRVSIEESNAVRMVMRLVRTHMMRDPRDPLDARRSLLSLTDTGRSVHAELRGRLARLQKALIQPLPPLAVPEFQRLTCQVARLPFNIVAG
ncbi:MarR family winged helix-turn-helix transcriptional regulator [Martelella alba]|uniref:MarR family transcriptional regulator n=1 Tax=Martelella alba TaxID=2590451 RepID=A0ABY2SKV1_9HYPH|nr:MarR family transcriptional regulator [Martelella alba]TKI06073.1 MarR family transcriptional regulator [Martelella alba]